MKYLLSTLFFIVSFSANAAEPSGAYTAYQLHVTAVVQAGNGVYIHFDKNHQCDAQTAYMANNRSDYDSLHKIFMTALTTQTPVSVDMRPTTPNATCNGSYSQVGYVCIGAPSSPCFSNW